VVVRNFSNGKNSSPGISPFPGTANITSALPPQSAETKYKIKIK
jgi:hypothetical protein